MVLQMMIHLLLHPDENDRQVMVGAIYSMQTGLTYSDPPDTGNGQMCNCNVEAVQRTVTKSDSPHHGRPFWTCPKSRVEQCGYFVSGLLDLEKQKTLIGEGMGG